MDLQSRITTGNRSLKMYASRLEKLEIFTYMDFLFHLPSRYEDYSIVSKVADVQPGETVTIQGQVLDIKTNYMRGSRIKSMQKATLVDGTGSIELLWFNQPFLTRTILPNALISASGKVNTFGKSRKLSLQAPQYEVLSFDGNGIHTGRLIPVYPETQGVTSKWLRRQIHTILTEHYDLIHEYLPEDMIKKYGFIPFNQALKEIHYPKDLDSAASARERLAFDELFLMQLGSNKRRADWKEKQKGLPFVIKKYEKKIDDCINSLPFTLTDAQRVAITNIFDDVQKDKPMNRLLQGDVGSGKTVIAAISMYAAYLNGYQSVLMAPTEILANQHYKSILKLLEPLGVKIALATGSKKEGFKIKDLGLKNDNENHKSSILNPKSHIFNILIGTHAVLSDKITFNKLGLVIIDEQQRFGVAQRGTIRQKGDNPHLLTMTATPIPRTVALTMYGDLDLSYLNEMPHGRKRVKTWLVPPEKRDGAYDWIHKQITETDSQIFIVCPFIEPSESMTTVKAVAHEYERLSKEVYPDLKLGLLHGKLKAKEKDVVLQKFRDKEYDILVATPVVEVGIDIPNATVIMIEAAERFGLAQLHQLRGRVGRGDKQSYCLLFTESKSEGTNIRLQALETVYSGAELSELDLKLRGHGNLYGTAQHGVPKLKAASFSDTVLIQKAKHAADEIFPHIAEYKTLEEKLEATLNENISPD
ncbi:MAG: ATP-dependent DNA helicase RecG [Candidatus Levybacteria bacterium]|nr:ATP-dependent DNA helicase RecG [Candidatus Levybacteria bacterium]